MLETYLIPFSTSPVPSKSRLPPQRDSWQVRVGKSWTRGSSANETLPNYNSECEEEVKALAEHIHSSCDDLPTDESFSLIILWEIGFKEQKVPLSVFGALKRAIEWHGALIQTRGGNLRDPLTEYLTPLTSSDPVHSLWRGNLAFFHGLDDDDLSNSNPYEELKGFCLQLPQESPPDVAVLPPGTKTLSRSLLVVSTHIDISSVPKPYLKDPICLKYECERNVEPLHFISSTYLSSKRKALLLRLETSENAKDFGSQLKTDQWTQSFQTDQDPSRFLVSMLGKHPESLFIIIQGGNPTNGSFSGWTLSSEGCQFHGSENTILEEVEGIPHYKFHEEIDVSAFLEFLKETEAKIIQTLSENEPYLLEEGSLNYTLGVIRRRIAERMGFSRSNDTYQPASSDLLPTEDEDEKVEIEMKRFLRFLSEQQRRKEEAASKASSHNPGSGSGGYIKWEVKELLKFFKQDGLARVKNSQTEVLSSVTKRQLPEGDNKAWPPLPSNDVMDVDYNLGEESEARDRRRMEILKTHVGLLKETISTGSSKTSDVIIPVSTSSKRQPPPLPVSSTTKPEEPPRTTSLRSSPRKKKHSSKEDIFKQKLRNAVFNALSSKGVGVKHELFRPCFKKLFEICKMFTGSRGPGGQGGSTKEWLNKVALQNVEPVLSLEKTLHSGSN